MKGILDFKLCEYVWLSKQFRAVVKLNKDASTPDERGQAQLDAERKIADKLPDTFHITYANRTIQRRFTSSELTLIRKEIDKGIIYLDEILKTYIRRMEEEGDADKYTSYYMNAEKTQVMLRALKGRVSAQLR